MKRSPLCFPSVPSHANKLLAVDYGCEPVAIIESMPDGQVHCLSRKDVDGSNISVVLTYPPIPLGSPNISQSAPGFICQHDLGRKYLQFKRDGGGYFESLVLNSSWQFRNFQTDRASLLHEGLLNELLGGTENEGKEATFFRNKNGWSTSSAKFYDRCQDRTQRERRYRRLKNFFHKTARVDVDEIPSDILWEYCDEALLQEYHQYADNKHLRNCIQSYYNACSNSACLVYPAGPSLTQLHCSRIGKHVSLGDTNSGLLDISLMKVQNVLGSIKELSCTSGEGLLVRGNYYASIFDMNGQEPLGTCREYQLDKEIFSACLCSRFQNDVILVLGQGQIVCATGEREPISILAARNDYSPPWQSCLPGSAPRTCLIGDDEEFILLDFRLPSVKRITYFELPSEYMNRYEKFAPALCRHPSDPYQTWLTTDQSLVLTDERFLKTPVLKCNHYMKSPPRFIECTLDFGGQCEDEILVTLGNYLHKETVNFRFKSSGSRDVPIVGCVSPVSVQDPMKMVSLPFKFSEYDEWETYAPPAWQMSCESFRQRLQQPLIGVCLLKQPASEARDCLYYVVQQSLCGDLFYQELSCSSRSSDDACGVGKKPSFRRDFAGTLNESSISLHSAIQSRCMEWIRVAFEDHCRQEKMSEAFQKVPVHGINWKTECVDCHRRSHRDHIDISLNVASEVNGDEVSECDRCVKKQSWRIWNDLVKAYRENSIPSRQSLGFKCESRSLHLVDNVDSFQNPVTRVLAANWDDDAYTPLETFAPHCVYKPSYRE